MAAELLTGPEHALVGDHVIGRFTTGQGSGRVGKYLQKPEGVGGTL